MKEFYRSLRALIDEGETVAVATVVNVRGSTPREVGAKMIIRRDGSIVGTVGGGCGEGDVRRAAVDVIDTLEPELVKVDLTEPVTMETDGVCGGIMEIFVEPWYPRAEHAGSREA